MVYIISNLKARRS